MIVPRVMEFGAIDGGVDDKHSDVGLSKISKICTMQDDYFFRVEPLDRDYAKLFCLL